MSAIGGDRVNHREARGLSGSNRTTKPGRGGKRTWLAAACTLQFFLCIGPAHGDDSDKAKSIVTKQCAACHGEDGNGSLPSNIPKLAGQHQDYIVRELREFISGIRKSDIMTPVAAALDPDDFMGLGAYFSAQKPRPNSVADQPAADAGKKIYFDGNEDSGVPACAGCHNLDGSGNKRFPRLAGQHKEYLIEQMHQYRADTRNNPFARAMREVAKRLTGDEIKAVAEFIGGM